MKHLDSIAESKFNHPSIVNGIHVLFGTTDYKKILVVWEIKKSELNEVREKASKYGIEIKRIGELLMELVGTHMVIGAKGSRDHIMRTIELMALIQNILTKK